MCDPVYGAFHGGDPREFFPDHECSTELEREAHRRACLIFEAHGQLFPLEPDHEWKFDKETGALIAHIARGQFGLGVYTVDCGDPGCQGSKAYNGGSGEGRP